MDKNDYITDFKKSKSGSHLTLEERIRIQVYRNEQGCSVREIGRRLGRAPNTILNELKRGTPPPKGPRGRKPKYTAKCGQKAYKKNRESSRRKTKLGESVLFLNWVTEQVKEHKWSLDACSGRAKADNKFNPTEMVCSRTLYNWAHRGCIPVTLSDLPLALKRKKSKSICRENKRIFGKSISERPEIVRLQKEEGHWEADTVIGKKKGGEAALLTLLEKKTRYYIVIRLSNKTSEAVMEAMNVLHKEFGDKFKTVFKTITVDNGTEFADFVKIEELGTEVYFAHPYSSWERAQNENCNGLLREFYPKGKSLEPYSSEDILAVADEINGRPRKKLNYRTAEEEFELFLDKVYSL